MENIIISPKTKKEAKLIIDLLNKINIPSKVITDEEKEDLGLLMMMKDTDLNDTVPYEEVMKVLNS
jgi:hypothetical protein